MVVLVGLEVLVDLEALVELVALVQGQLGSLRHLCRASSGQCYTGPRVQSRSHKCLHHPTCSSSTLVPLVSAPSVDKVRVSPVDHTLWDSCCRSCIFWSDLCCTVHLVQCTGHRWCRRPSCSNSTLVSLAWKVVAQGLELEEVSGVALEGKVQAAMVACLTSGSPSS